MVSVVNGYVCFSGCDEAKARQGKDPDAPPGSPPGTKAEKPFDQQPATVFGGSLKDRLSANPVDPAASDQAPGGPPRASVNLLV
jgi:hypothetical protein